MTNFDKNCESVYKDVVQRIHLGGFLCFVQHTIIVISPAHQTNFLINEIEWLFLSKAKEKLLKFTANIDGEISRDLLSDLDRIKKQCINAGIYEYLGNPLNKMQFNQILRKFINTHFSARGNLST